MNSGVAWRRYSTVARARCAGALSCWNTNTHQPSVGLQEASGAIAKHLGNKHLLKFTPGSTKISSVHPSFETATDTMTDLLNVGPSAKQTVGDNVALLRPTRRVKTVVLEVHMRCNSKLIIMNINGICIRC